MRNYALTYPQLVNQALAQELDADVVSLLRGTHELAEEMADGLYRSQSVPLLCHLVRTASIVMRDEQPIAVVQAAYLHAAYLLHVFGGSRRRVGGPARKAALCARVGEEVECLIGVYHETPWYGPTALDTHLEALDSYCETTRQVLGMRCANELEDYLDGAMAYTPVRGRESLAGHATRCVSLAERLGRLALARDLREVFDGHLAMRLPQAALLQNPSGYERAATHLWEASPMERMARSALRKLRAVTARARAKPPRSTPQ